MDYPQDEYIEVVVVVLMPFIYILYIYINYEIMKL
jgi:hypothetical protein